MTDIVKELRLPASIDQADAQRRLAADEIERLQNELDSCAECMKRGDAKIERLRDATTKQANMIVDQEVEIERLRRIVELGEGQNANLLEDLAEQSDKIKKLHADLRICWNWGDPTDMTMGDKSVWERLNKDFGE